MSDLQTRLKALKESTTHRWRIYYLTGAIKLCEEYEAENATLRAERDALTERVEKLERDPGGTVWQAYREGYADARREYQAQLDAEMKATISSPVTSPPIAGVGQAWKQSAARQDVAAATLPKEADHE